MGIPELYDLLLTLLPQLQQIAPSAKLTFHHSILQSIPINIFENMIIGTCQRIPEINEVLDQVITENILANLLKDAVLEMNDVAIYKDIWDELHGEERDIFLEYVNKIRLHVKEAMVNYRV